MWTLVFLTVKIFYMHKRERKKHNRSLLFEFQEGTSSDNGKAPLCPTSCLCPFRLYLPTLHCFTASICPPQFSFRSQAFLPFPTCRWIQRSRGSDERSGEPQQDGREGDSATEPSQDMVSTHPVTDPCSFFGVLQRIRKRCAGVCVCLYVCVAGPFLSGCRYRMAARSQTKAGRGPDSGSPERSGRSLCFVPKL